MKVKRHLFLIVITILSLTLAACGGDTENTNANESDKNASAANESVENLTESGMPIVNEPLTLSFMGRGGTTMNYNDILIWKEYEEMTGIHVDWDIGSRDGFAEKKNLALASDDLPDVFYTADVSNLDLEQYGRQGSFVNLTDLIQEHMPNLTKLFEENPDIKKGMTFPDGNIYSLPTIYEPEFKSVLAGHKGWVRQEWLEQLDMGIPQTTEEYYKYLKAVKETDLNDNGESDEIPLGGQGTTALIRWIQGAFGVGNKGIKHPFIDEDPDSGEVRFYPAADGYKEMLEYLHKLYNEDLILQNIFTIEGDQHYAMGSEGLYGSVVTNNPEAQFDNEEGRYVGMPALEGPNGDRLYTYVTSSLAHMGGFVITKENPNVPATLRWMDYFYSDEGAKLFFMGKEGVTFETKENGEIDYLDEMKNDPDLPLDQKLSQYVTWAGGGYPGLVKEAFFKGSESLPSSLEATETFEEHLPEEVWPSFTYTAEESSELGPLAADIEKYVGEMLDKFITGDESLEDWDTYIQTLENMGLEDYMRIQEAAVERYYSN